jgi:hypothetical protein
MLQHLIATWKITLNATTTHCAVLALATVYRVIVTVNGEPLADELHDTCASALARAEDLRTFLLAHGFDADALLETVTLQ